MLIEIREEKENEYFEVEKMIRESFFNVYRPGAEEHLLVHKLRNDESYIKELSRIALVDGKIVGAIYYSKGILKTEDNVLHEVITFGPLGVLPSYQKLGIGCKLVEETIKLAKDKYNAIVITGVPTYYPRFGFKKCFDYNISMFDGSQFDALMALELKENYFSKLGKSYFKEADIYEIRASKEELDQFDSQFPYLEKKKLPGQFE